MMTFNLEELPEGPWKEDFAKYPEDKYVFDCGDGYEGKIVKSGLGNWNGYVKLPPNHPDFYRSYNDLEKEIRVHGDLTYGSVNGTFGFDTAHSTDGDIVPAYQILNGDPKYGPLFKMMEMKNSLSKTHFWTFEEVKKEIFSMADQFKARMK